MSTAMEQRGPEGLPPHVVPAPFSPEFPLGPQWFGRGVEPIGTEPADAASGSDAGTAAEAAVAEATAAVPSPAGAPVTARDVAETAMRTVVGIEAAIAGLEAMRLHLLAGVGAVAIDDARAERLDPAVGLRDVAAELGLRLRRSDRTVEREISTSMRLLECWPATVAAWGQARISRAHLMTIAEIGAPLQNPEARAEFEATLLPRAEQTTPGRLRAIARTELERHFTEPLAVRHEEARKGRRVTVTDLDDGMSLWQAWVPTVLAHGGDARLTQMAKVADPDDPRTFEQRRADAFCDLLLTGEPTGAAIDGVTADITMIMPAPVLLGDDGVSGTTASDGTGSGCDAVARLANGAPIDPETARLLAGRSTLWTRLFTDPVKGQVVAVDTYTPSKQLRRLLRARDQQCRWPGCTGKVQRCDIDHTKPWAEGGKTEVGNLANFCRRHHVLKGAQLANARRWKVRQLSPGVLEFTSPMGERYVDEPPRVGPVFREEPGPEREPWGAPGEAVARSALPF